jgi:hypothetical protein
MTRTAVSVTQSECHPGDGAEQTVCRCCPSRCVRGQPARAPWSLSPRRHATCRPPGEVPFPYDPDRVDSFPLRDRPGLPPRARAGYFFFGALPSIVTAGRMPIDPGGHRASGRTERSLRSCSVQTRRGIGESAMWEFLTRQFRRSEPERDAAGPHPTQEHFDQLVARLAGLCHLPARRAGPGGDLERRGRADQGVPSGGDRRQALLPVLPARRRGVGLAGSRAERGGGHRAV